MPRFRLKSLMLAVSLLAGMLGAWQWLIRAERFVIDDDGVGEHHRFEATSLLRSPTSLAIRFHGEIDGTAEFVTHGGNVTTPVGPGKFDVRIREDQYESRSFIEYRPQGATTGRVVISCRFGYL